ncbi:MAG: hypothetical protein ABIU95_15520, partial [Burkholderiales bacterium]
ETLSLRYRTADQVIAFLRPLVEPGGVVTGMLSTSIVRGSRSQIDQVERALAALEAPPRRLVIQVRQDAASQSNASGFGARVYSSRDSADTTVAQQVQGLDGQPSTILIGRSVPVVTQTATRSVFGAGISESMTYREVNTGVSVVPRMAGDRVTLELGPQRERAPSDGMVGPPPEISGQRIVTSVSGRLGEWMDVGGAAAEVERSSGRIVSSNQASIRRDCRVWVRVEEVR